MKRQMITETHSRTLEAEGLEKYQRLQAAAVRAVTDRFHSTYASVYER